MTVQYRHQVASCLDPRHRIKTRRRFPRRAIPVRYQVLTCHHHRVIKLFRDREQQMMMSC